MAVQVVEVAVDFTQYAETYSFRECPRVAALPVALPCAADLADAGCASPQADIRLAAQHLSCALEDLTQQLGRGFLRMEGTTRELHAAYAEDHGQEQGLHGAAQDPPGSARGGE